MWRLKIALLTLDASPWSLRRAATASNAETFDCSAREGGHARDVLVAAGHEPSPPRPAFSDRTPAPRALLRQSYEPLTRGHPGGAHLTSSVFLLLSNSCNMEPGASPMTNKTVNENDPASPTCSAMGTEPRLRIMRLLLSAHPEGLVVGDIATELEIPSSTLSHHLDSSRTKTSSTSVAKAPFCAIRRTPTPCKPCSASSTPNAARATARWNRAGSSPPLNGRNRPWVKERVKDVVRKNTAQAALAYVRAGNACCGSARRARLLRSDHLQPLRRDEAASCRPRLCRHRSAAATRRRLPN